jgi:hypothetical protein
MLATLPAPVQCPEHDETDRSAWGAMVDSRNEADELRRDLTELSRLVVQLAGVGLDMLFPCCCTRASTCEICSMLRIARRHLPAERPCLVESVDLGTAPF